VHGFSSPLYHFLRCHDYQTRSQRCIRQPSGRIRVSGPPPSSETGIAMALPPASDRDRWLTGLSPGSRVGDAAAPRHNSAATLSLICALLWPLCLLGPILIMQVGIRPHYPDWGGALIGPVLFATPVIGVISGVVGMVRSLRAPAQRASWWRAVVGVVLGFIWLLATVL
jgi:hypothetical protein